MGCAVGAACPWSSRPMKGDPTCEECVYTNEPHPRKSSPKTVAAAWPPRRSRPRQHQHRKATFARALWRSRPGAAAACAARRRCSWMNGSGLTATSSAGFASKSAKTWRKSWRALPCPCVRPYYTCARCSGQRTTTRRRCNDFRREGSSAS